uniref:Ig-like domain-containing protein n=1 Tax=Listeria rocourtiae TaxID=647910 RepID=UPI003D2F6674
MKKKTKKILTGLLAFNVVATTPLTLLSTASASAAEMKQYSSAENTKQPRSVNQVNLIDVSNLGDKATRGYGSDTNAVTLTKDDVFANGYIVTKQKVNLKNSFTLKTRFGIGGGASKADGITFFMQNAVTPSFGVGGDAMRINGISKTLGIAFRHQTWYTPARNNISFYTQDAGFFKYQNSFPSGSNYDLTINWDGPSKTLSYNYAGKIDSYKVSDMNKVFGGTEAIIGFTGVCGNGTNTHVLYNPLLTVNSGNDPIINTSDRIINLGENFNPLQGVSATDVEDGDLTSQVKVIGNNVDTNKTGSYTVIYSVTDQNSNTTIKIISVKVTLPAPVLSDVYDNSDKLTVKGYPNAEITTTLPDGTRITKNANAQGEATFAVSGLKENEVIRAFQSLSGQNSPEASTVVKGAIPDAPTISPITTNDTTITVTGEPNAKIILFLPDGTELSKTADVNGKATFNIGTQKLGDVIKAIQTGTNGKPSEEAFTTVTAGTIAAPTINSVTTDDTKVTGTGIAGATVTIKANNMTYTGVVTADGTYSITIPKQAADTLVTAIQSKDGVTSTSVNTRVIDNRTLAAPTINDYYVNDGYVSGTAPVGA